MKRGGSITNSNLGITVRKMRGYFFVALPPLLLITDILFFNTIADCALW